jgi:hypothetical protein
MTPNPTAALSPTNKGFTTSLSAAPERDLFFIRCDETLQRKGRSARISSGSSAPCSLFTSRLTLGASHILHWIIAGKSAWCSPLTSKAARFSTCLLDETAGPKKKNGNKAAHQTFCFNVRCLAPLACHLNLSDSSLVMQEQPGTSGWQQQTCTL